MTITIAEDKEGNEFSLIPTNLTRIDTRQQMRNMRNNYPNAILLTDQGRRLPSVEGAYAYIDSEEPIYFVIGFTRLNFTPTLGQRFKKWVTTMTSRSKKS